MSLCELLIVVDPFVGGISPQVGWLRFNPDHIVKVVLQGASLLVALQATPAAVTHTSVSGPQYPGLLGLGAKAPPRHSHYYGLKGYWALILKAVFLVLHNARRRLDTLCSKSDNFIAKSFFLAHPIWIFPRANTLERQNIRWTRFSPTPVPPPLCIEAVYTVLELDWRKDTHTYTQSTPFIKRAILFKRNIAQFLPGCLRISHLDFLCPCRLFILVILVLSFIYSYITYLLSTYCLQKISLVILWGKENEKNLTLKDEADVN